MTPELQQPYPEFALIVGAARSGTTLQRVLLDAHSEIACPAEAGVPALMSHMAQVWSTVNADSLDDMPETDPGQAPPERTNGQLKADPDDNQEEAKSRTAPNLPEPARQWIAATVQKALQSYCDRQRKRVYVDKSLDSVYHLELVHQVFPATRAVLAVRHVMDTIASGIEASPWGFQAYGYAPYVQRFPGNTVAALASYWLDHVTAALEWERQHPEALPTHAIRGLGDPPRPSSHGHTAFP